MQQFSDWFFSIVFFSGILGFLVATILFFVNKTDTFSSRILAAFLFTFSLLALNYALMTTAFYLRYPHYWRVLGWASFSFAPFAYLYVRSVLQQSYSFRRYDFIFFVPALLHALNLLPFYILPASDKVEIIRNALNNKKLITLEPEGLWPEGWSVWLRVLVGIVTSIGQILLLKRWKPIIFDRLSTEKQNRETFQWLTLFSIVHALFWGLIMMEFIFHFTMLSDLNYLIIFTISGTILFVSLFLLVRPSILYGLKGWLQKEDTPVSQLELNKHVPEPAVSNRNSLSVEQGEAFKQALESHFRDNLPFRKNGYTIGDLSHELNIPSHQLSAFINQEYGKNFNELINEYRVDFLAGMIKSSTDHFQYTLEALGKEAGFNSRAAFISAVKKRTGKTPSEFFGRKGETLSQ
jgi:AraC-like DNA-binding protein